MKKISAGLLMYRTCSGAPEVFLAHPGGPFFSKKDRGVWTIPKGEPQPGEDFLSTAIREFQEETGITPPGPFLSLDHIQQKGGKIVWAWAFNGSEHPENLASNTFELEWPPRSGRMQVFPEVDRVEFFSSVTAREKINPAQIPFIERLEKELAKESAG